MRRSVRQTIVTLVTSMAMTATTFAPAFAKEPTAKVSDAPKIQMAILLDCSGSMSGLINQARTQLWNTVDQFANARLRDQPVQLQVGLYAYGSNRYPGSEGYLSQLVPLTDDLDRVSEALFALNTGGSAEFCGQVIDTATRELQWSSNQRDLKFIFIAGNEPFTQGPVDFRLACRAAVSKDITVNTIHCGTSTEGISGKWPEGAQLADGSFMNIDHNQQIVAIPAPQDKQLAELSEKLNKTYVAYGKPVARRAAIERQREQDKNASESNPAAASVRASFKRKEQYRNDSWDIVDACREGKVKLSELTDDQLPDNMKAMSLEQREAYIKNKQQQRGEIQKRIGQLSSDREEFLVEARKQQSENGGDTLDDAILKAARAQAGRKNYTFLKN